MSNNFDLNLQTKKVDTVAKAKCSYTHAPSFYCQASATGCPTKNTTCSNS